ncbi:hypothetical protein, partial [Rhizobium leguminosarum]|uniref:hypothetical protein n=1 Tax=Rhizobium leguminosarum TaxID=384 RepID=UPI00197D040E
DRDVSDEFDTAAVAVLFDELFISLFPFLSLMLRIIACRCHFGDRHRRAAGQSGPAAPLWFHLSVRMCAQRSWRVPSFLVKMAQSSIVSRTSCQPLFPL